MNQWIQDNLVSIIVAFGTLIGAIGIHSISLLKQWINMKRDIEENKLIAKRDVEEIKSKVDRMDEGHDKRLAALEGTLKNIEISTGKIETKVELILTANRNKL